MCLAFDCQELLDLWIKVDSNRQEIGSIPSYLATSPAYAEWYTQQSHCSWSPTTSCPTGPSLAVFVAIDSPSDQV